MRPARILAALALAALALAAGCRTDPARPSEPSPPASPASASAPASAAPAVGCRLPAPVKSEDACTTDADCGPAEPCHAKQCVAKAKSKPRTADTVCTMMLTCNTTDTNRCGCYEGRCSLIPPPATAP